MIYVYGYHTAYSGQIKADVLSDFVGKYAVAFKDTERPEPARTIALVDDMEEANIIITAISAKYGVRSNHFVV